MTTENLDGKGNLGVLLIDMQRGCLTHHDSIKVEAMIKSQQDVLRACEKRNIPTWVIYFRNNREIDIRLLAYLGRIPRRMNIHKKFNSAFGGTDLEEQLRAHQVGWVFLMGVNKSYCVLRTAMDALARDFGVSTCGSVIGDKKSIRPDARRYAGGWYKDNRIYVPSLEAIPEFR